MVRVKIPATSANIGSGFDSLGLALNLYNNVWLEEYDGVDISPTDGLDIPQDKTNLIYSSAEILYQECGKKLSGLKLKQDVNIPITRGLGSSSACIIAGLLGANKFLGDILSTNDIINLASRIEGHPDNIAPAILGGFVVSAMENGKVYTIKTPVSKKIKFAIFIPPFELETYTARRVLKEQYKIEDVIYNLSRSALMTASLFSGNFENLNVAIKDKIHQPYRMRLIPGASDIFDISSELGAYGAYISGAGPCIVSIISSEVGNKFKKEAAERLAQRGITGWKIKIQESDADGATVYID